MNELTLDWPALERLRTAFLEGKPGQEDYWRSASDLASYDATFAQRIGWKWDHVLAELGRRGWTPPPATTLLDWGCGSGIAARAFLDCFGQGCVTEARFWDRSALAMQFAVARARSKYDGLPVETGLPARPGLVLVSHVLTELTEEQAATLAEWLKAATTVLWVEPGTYDASRRLIAIRERLVGKFHVVAPCPHGAVCGMLAAGNEAHWCHHFAASPPAVFTDSFWGRFARTAGIDLTRLPLSFLVLDRRPAPALAPGTVRVIGRPRVYKAHAAVLACDADGVGEFEVFKRHLPAMFRRFRKDDCPALQTWTRDGERVIDAVDTLSGA